MPKINCFRKNFDTAAKGVDEIFLLLRVCLLVVLLHAQHLSCFMVLLAPDAMENFYCGLNEFRFYPLSFH